MCIIVEFRRVDLSLLRVRIFCALDFKLQDYRVVIVWRGHNWFLFRWFFVPLEPSEPCSRSLERYKAKTVSKNFVLDNRGIVPDENILNGKCWDFSNEDAAERICDRGVDADEGEGTVQWFRMVNYNLKVLGTNIK